MRKLHPKPYEKRTRAFFAFTPFTIYSYSGFRDPVPIETRWFEFVRIEEEYRCGKWYPTKFINEDEI